MDFHQFDEEYIRRLIAGDIDTGAHFTAYFSQLLLLKLRARLNDRQQVEDARQETFVRVLSLLRSKGGLDHAERLGAFVSSVCSNVVFEMYRAQSRAGQFPDEMDDPPDHRFDTESEFISSESKAQVRHLLEELPDRDRQVLQLMFYDEADKDAICRKMNVSGDYLRVLLHRAKVNLRNKLRGTEEKSRS